MNKRRNTLVKSHFMHSWGKFPIFRSMLAWSYISRQDILKSFLLIGVDLEFLYCIHSGKHFVPQRARFGWTIHDFNTLWNKTVMRRNENAIFKRQFWFNTNIFGLNFYIGKAADSTEMCFGHYLGTKRLIRFANNFPKLLA